MFTLKDITMFLAGRRRDTIRFNGQPAGAFSQRGEDLIIDGLLEGKRIGFYVDVGANHPTFLSNTKRFYDRGWHGINIEPNPALAKLLWQERERDVVINKGVGSTKGVFPFYLLSMHTNSSFNKEDAYRNCLFFDDSVKDVIQVPVEPLADILRGYSPDHIDFMSIDTEGSELDVLKSNDWKRFSPGVLVVETENDKAIEPFLESVGYHLIYSNNCNGIFWKVPS